MGEGDGEGGELLVDIGGRGGLGEREEQAVEGVPGVGSLGTGGGEPGGDGGGEGGDVDAGEGRERSYTEALVRGWGRGFAGVVEIGLDDARTLVGRPF